MYTWCALKRVNCNMASKEAPAEENADNDSLQERKRVETDEKIPTDAKNASPSTKEEDVKHSLSLNWCFGINSAIPVHNISNSDRKMIFYVSSHTGVLFDCENNCQSLLQGHSNAISCTAVSSDRRWLVTADIGTNSMVIVWDSFSVIPVRTFFDGLDIGPIAVAMSNDVQYVATISAGPLQEVCIWEWTVESEKPLCSAKLNVDYGQQTRLTFHPNNSHQLVSNSEDTVVFYTWRGNQVYVNSIPVSDKDFSRSVGSLVESVFLPMTQQAVTVTSEGNGIVWEAINEGNSQNDPLVRKPMKLIKLHDSPITVATSCGNLLVSGDSVGQIKFFDSDLKLLNWYDNTIGLGPLTSISFAHDPLLPALKKDGENQSTHFYPTESTMGAPPFIIPDFVISSQSAEVAHVTTNGSTTDIIFREHDAATTALATHPNLPRLLVGSYSCALKLWDYDKKQVLSVRSFKEPNYIQCVAFDPKGHYVGVGFTNGVVAILDSLTLEDVCVPFRYSKDTVTHISFSHDSNYLATADRDNCVTVFVSDSESSEQPWQFLARHRAHYKTIEDLMFGVKLDSDTPRLISLGSDRTMVEYDISESGVDDLRILSSDRIEQSALPTAMTWYPALTKESFILLANTQYKLKLLNSTTKMCRRTLLGPTFGSPIKKLVLLPSPVLRGSEGEEIRRYLAYITSDKVGVLLLPHDGNPHNSVCAIAHPGMVTNMVCSNDGRYVFTAGGEDCTVNMWTVDTNALEAAALLGGKELEPFYSMLEGGREGEFFLELEEYFYYAQITSQGPDTVSSRKVSTTIPIEQIPYVMRAIGYYPSEQEVEDMLNEVKFSKFVDSGDYVTEIDLGDFLKLYVNHRPAFGLSPSQLGKAFKVLGERHGAAQQWTVDRATLLTLLQEKGEHLTETELVEHLMTVLGFSDNPEVKGSYSEDTETALGELPDKVTAAMFAEELLGLSTQ